MILNIYLVCWSCLRISTTKLQTLTRQENLEWQSSTHIPWVTNYHILSETARKYSLIGFHGKPSHDFWGNLQNVSLFQKNLIHFKKHLPTLIFFFHQKANLLKSEVFRFLNVIHRFPRSEFWTSCSTVHVSDGLHSLSVTVHGSSSAIWEMSCLPWVVKPI